MASSSALFKLAYALLVCMVMVAPHAEAAISCGLVASSLTGCLSYLRGRGPRPPPACCAGIRKLAGMARTPVDRRATCNCIKSASRGMRNLDMNKAAGIPRSCRISIPYAISPRTDCSRVR